MLTFNVGSCKIYIIVMVSSCGTQKCRLLIQYVLFAMDGIRGEIMKKDYQKPAALIQDMTVNSFVAGACTDAGGTLVTLTEDTCSYTDEGSSMTFFSGNCEDGSEWGVNIVNPNSQSPFAQLCYHRPLDALSFFSS